MGLGEMGNIVGGIPQQARQQRRAHPGFNHYEHRPSKKYLWKNAKSWQIYKHSIQNALNFLPVKLLSGNSQTSDDLILTALCETFLPICSKKLRPDIKIILVVLSNGVRCRATLTLVEKLRQSLGAQVTIGAIEEDTEAEEGGVGERWVKVLLHDMELNQDNYDTKIVRDRIKHGGLIKLFDEHDLVVAGFGAGAGRHEIKPVLWKSNWAGFSANLCYQLFDRNYYSDWGNTDQRGHCARQSQHSGPADRYFCGRGRDICFGTVARVGLVVLLMIVLLVE